MIKKVWKVLGVLKKYDNGSVLLIIDNEDLIPYIAAPIDKHNHYAIVRSFKPLLDRFVKDNLDPINLFMDKTVYLWTRTEDGGYMDTTSELTVTRDDIEKVIDKSEKNRLIEPDNSSEDENEVPVPKMNRNEKHLNFPLAAMFASVC